ncbi:MAG TPA: hypothetical protein DCP32_00080 [Anaerolineaceae bacterium]|nr:MAG: hypothetical protein A2X24_01580 [Chloroflexi bacterium GWB2_54_36]HAL15185.1 hypothetical protein [Anaerolineaceae bacterium]HBA92533.1 hypothetical protein [Anaerolineaceae bacterium]
MNSRFRNFIPLGVGILGAIFLAAIYFGIVSWAESPEHAVDLFWEDRWLVIPILLGFGIQAALYSVLKLRLYLPASSNTPEPGAANPAPAASMGAGGATSTVAMVACCAHHAADVLPILGLTAAATFLAEYRTAFMAAGLASNLIGIVVIWVTILRARRMALHMQSPMILTEEI